MRELKVHVYDTEYQLTFARGGNKKEVVYSVPDDFKLKGLKEGLIEKFDHSDLMIGARTIVKVTVMLILRNQLDLPTVDLITEKGCDTAVRINEVFDYVEEYLKELE